MEEKISHWFSFFMFVVIYYPSMTVLILIIIIMVICRCYFSGEHIALSIKNNNNGVNIELGKTNRLKALCMMQITT